MTIQEFRAAEAEHVARTLERHPVVRVLTPADHLDHALKNSIRYLRSAQGEHGQGLPETGARIEDVLEDLETARRALAKEAQ